MNFFSEEQKNETDNEMNPAEAKNKRILETKEIVFLFITSFLLFTRKNKWKTRRAFELRR